MAQHFLLSAAARTLSLAKVLRALVEHTPAIIREKGAFGRKLGQEAIEHMVSATCAKVSCGS